MLFASIFVPDFSLQALFAKRPELQTEAIALIDGTPPILKVVAANEPACKLGVEVGLMKAQAEAVGVHIIQRSVELEDAAHALLLTCARSFSPRVQDKAMDLIVLDIDGLNSLFGSPEQIAARIHSSLLRERLSVNVSVAGNPDSAMIAARGYHGTTIIAAAAQIGRLPLSLLELSPAQLETLNLWGITTLGGLVSLDAKALSQRLGQPGVQLQKLARGQQVNPFVADVVFKFWCRRISCTVLMSTFILTRTEASVLRRVWKPNVRGGAEAVGLATPRRISRLIVYLIHRCSSAVLLRSVWDKPESRMMSVHPWGLLIGSVCPLGTAKADWQCAGSVFLSLGSRIRLVFEHSHHYCESAIRILVPGGQTSASIPKPTRESPRERR